jgi:Xaa-Pro aminopeptidase
MPANFDHRLAQLQAQVGTTEAFFLSNPADIEYLTGFACLVPEEREAFLVLTTSKMYLIHASFSPTPPTKVIKLSGTHLAALEIHLKQIVSDQTISKIYVDKSRLFADEYEILQQVPHVELQALDRKKIWSQRMSKDQAEIAAVKRAGQIASQAFDQLFSQIKIGMTEKEIQKLLETNMTALGSEKPAFPTIVAFGPHGALPHHQPTDVALAPNTAILLDFGATYDHYRSDMTRSWWFSQDDKSDSQSDATPEFMKIKNLVDEAYQRGVEYLRNTVKTRTAQGLDKVCRTFIDEMGYGRQFIHTTGHGVGLEIHEPPSLYWKNDIALLPGMIITIEPGIYISDAFGYRWENTVLVTEDGLETLTT